MYTRTMDSLLERGTMRRVGKEGIAWYRCMASMLGNVGHAAVLDLVILGHTLG